MDFSTPIPAIELRLDGTNEPTDFMREAVDVEIRHGEGRWPGLFVEGLAEESFLAGVCALVRRTHPPIAADELLQFRLIHSVEVQVQWSQWFARAGVLTQSNGSA